MATFREITGNWFIGIGNMLQGVMQSSAERDRYNELVRRGNYFAGNQPKQIKVKVGKEDDNITLNHIKKIVRKSANMLAGGKIEFDFDEDDQYSEYIDGVYKRNRKEIMLLNAAKMAGKYGTGYIQILPDYYDDGTPRLQRLHPIQMTITTAPEDIETVVKYVQRYTFIRDNKEVARKRETVFTDYVRYNELGMEESVQGWLVIDYEVSANTKGKWREVDRIEWPYDFPPLIHWQNEPTDESPYGDPDADDTILDLNDKINYNNSKIGKILRYHSHPKTWGRGFSGKEKRTWGEDEVVVLQGEGMLQNLEMQSDMHGSMEYVNSLTQNIYDLTGTVSLSTIKDKLGQLTNFGLRVLYQDALEKLYSKRLTFGEMLVELNRRLLVMQFEGYDGTGGKVVWPADVIPQDQMEEANLLEKDVQNEFVSKETARGLRGYDNDTEVERIQAEKPQDIGATLLAALNRGQ